MKKLEVTGQIDAQGRLVLEHLPLPQGESGLVKVILMYPDEYRADLDPDNEPTEEVEASLRRALQQVREGQRVPLSEIWDELKEN